MKLRIKIFSDTALQSNNTHRAVTDKRAPNIQELTNVPLTSIHLNNILRTERGKRQCQLFQACQKKDSHVLWI